MHLLLCCERTYISVSNNFNERSVKAHLPKELKLVREPAVRYKHVVPFIFKYSQDASNKRNPEVRVYLTNFISPYILQQASTVLIFLPIPIEILSADKLE